MTQSNGYFFAGSKFAGLIRIPSMVVPSWLFQEMTSRVPSVNGFVCAFMSVSLRGASCGIVETNTSLILVGEPAVKAMASLLRVSEKPLAIGLFGDKTVLILAELGSTRNR